MPITDLRLPLEYYEDGTIKSQLRADSAKVQANGRIEASNIIVEFYGEEGNVESVIKADECHYSKEARVATSESSVRLEREDVVITGTGFEWNVEEQCVKIFDNVKVILTKERFKVQGSRLGNSPRTRRRSGNVARVTTGNPEPGTLNHAETNATVITSKHLSFDNKRCIAIFTENVEVVDPQIRIKSDELRVLFDKDNNVKSLTALGRVRLWHADKAATCRKAIYLVKKGEVILIGDAVVRNGQGSLMGNKITYWPDEDRMICEPGRLIIVPQAENNQTDLNRSSPRSGARTKFTP